ncbi:MAG: ATP-binding protein [Sulfuricellaceae bacterium]
MRISTGFRFGSAIGGIILAAAVLSFGYNQIFISEAVAQKAILDKVVIEGMQLVQLTNEVLLYREERVTQQWWAQYNEESELVAKNNGPIQGRGGALWRRISAHLADMQLLFEHLAAHIEEQPVAPTTTRSILSSQLFQKAALLQTSLTSLGAVAQAELENGYRQARERTMLTFGVFFAAISLFVAVSSFLFRKRVLVPLRNLETSIHRVNEGDRTHRAQVFSEDEIGVVCHAFNKLIDQQELSREKLREREARLSAMLAEQNTILDNAVVGIAFVKERRFISVNHKLEKMFGYPAEEFLGRLTEMLYALPEDYRSFGEEIYPVLASGDNYSTELQMKRKDGSLFWCQLSGKLVDRGDASQGSIWIIHDISDRREAQDKLKLLNETLERRVQEELVKNREKDHILIQQSRLAAMGEMIHNIAHQWRQPINALTLLLANIKDAFEYDELTKEYLDREVKSGQDIIQNMSDTIDDFRNFFKPTQEKAPFALQQAVGSAIAMVEAALRNNEIAISILPAEAVVVNGHSNEFSQVVVNLISNAKDAIMEKKIHGGEIRIAIGKTHERAWLSVADNGGGVPEAALGKVFDPYFTTKGAKGTGIGLYMSKMILDKMDGDISIRNIEGGAEVRLTLPLASDK